MRDVSRPKDNILRLAGERFGELTEAELELLETTTSGTRPQAKRARRPELADKWPEKRSVRPAVLQWLCADAQARTLVHPEGITVRAAQILGDIDLTGAELRFPLWMHSCAIQGDILLRDARIRRVSLERSLCNAVIAEGLRCEGSVFLRDGFVAHRAANFRGASIDGLFDCTNASFGNNSGVALDANGLVVGGSLLLRGSNGGCFRARGGVALNSASVGGKVECADASFSNPKGLALDLRYAKVGAIVFLGHGFYARGKVSLIGADIGELSCLAGRFSNQGHDAINADRIKTKGPVHLRHGFRASGTVRFVGASIGGDLDCEGGSFIARGGEAQALILDGATVGGRLFLREGFKATGEVRLASASIGLELDCHNGSFANDRRVALRADGVRATGDVMLSDGFCAKGTVRLVSASTGGTLNCKGASFIGSPGRENRPGLDATGATINGSFVWRDVTLAEGARLLLSNVSASRFEDDEESWPAPGNLVVTGFSYHSIGGIPPSETGRPALPDAFGWLRKQLMTRGIPRTKRQDWTDARINWLRLESKAAFSPWPYEMLANVLRDSGHEAEAKRVAIAKQDDRRQYGSLSRWAWIGNWILKVTIGYGYRPQRALWCGLFFILLGTIIFSLAHRHGLLPQVKQKHPAFSSFGYSLDTFVPIINFRAEGAWAPSGRWAGGFLIQLYLWIHLAAGWLLTTLGVLGVSGLIRRR
jgi:hypothetical protein